MRLPPVPDLLGEDVRLLFVGINPSLRSSETGLHFAHPGNRFYPALASAGIIGDDDVEPAAAAVALRRAGVGITNLAPRPTARASELSREELREAPSRLAGTIAHHSPRVVAIAGVTAYRTAFAAPRAAMGRQEDIAGAELWIVPNPSGLNAHETIGSLAVAYAEVAVRAGVLDR